MVKFSQMTEIKENTHSGGSVLALGYIPKIQST